MENRKLEKDLIFYTPGQPGQVFTLKAGNFVDDQLINQTVDHLTDEMESRIEWVDERRISPRPS